MIQNDISIEMTLQMLLSIKHVRLQFRSQGGVEKFKPLQIYDIINPIVNYWCIVKWSMSANLNILHLTDF